MSDGVSTKVFGLTAVPDRIQTGTGESLSREGRKMERGNEKKTGKSLPFSAQKEPASPCNVKPWC